MVPGPGGEPAQDSLRKARTRSMAMPASAASPRPELGRAGQRHRRQDVDVDEAGAAPHRPPVLDDATSSAPLATGVRVRLPCRSGNSLRIRGSMEASSPRTRGNTSTSPCSSASPTARTSSGSARYASVRDMRLADQLRRRPRIRQTVRSLPEAPALRVRLEEIGARTRLPPWPGRPSRCVLLRACTI